ncbi:unnamed protein product, partial [Symbiodinium natans]
MFADYSDMLQSVSQRKLGSQILSAQSASAFLEWQNIEIQRGLASLIKDHGRRSAWTAALSLLSQAANHDVSLATVSATLAALSKATQWMRTLQLFQEMPSLKVVQDTVAHNTAAAACLKAGHWTKALSVLHKAFHGNFHPT